MCCNSSRVGSSAQCKSSNTATMGVNRADRSTNERYALNKNRRCCSGGSWMAAGIFGNILRNSGMSFATSGASPPSKWWSDSRGAVRTEYSSISMNGTYGGAPSIS